MLSFDPLRKTLKEKGIVLSDLREEIGLNSRTQANINKDEFVSLKTVASICVYLNVPIEKVVEIKHNTADNKNGN